MHAPTMLHSIPGWSQVLAKVHTNNWAMIKDLIDIDKDLIDIVKLWQYNF